LGLDSGLASYGSAPNSTCLCLKPTFSESTSYFIGGPDLDRTDDLFHTIKDRFANPCIYKALVAPESTVSALERVIVPTRFPDSAYCSYANLFRIMILVASRVEPTIGSNHRFRSNACEVSRLTRGGSHRRRQSRANQELGDGGQNCLQNMHIVGNARLIWDG
jgi:hypothetical protein